MNDKNKTKKQLIEELVEMRRRIAGQKMPADASLLRNQIEKLIKEKNEETDNLLAKGDLRKMVHELQVHKIELELQNEELKQTRDETIKQFKRYSDFYDFAPSGYFTLDGKGTILEVNHTGAKLLKTERSSLVGRNFKLFISDKFRPAFNAFLKTLNKEIEHQGYETALLQEGDQLRYIQINGISTKYDGDDDWQYQLAVIDIDELKRAEIALQKAQRYTEEVIETLCEPLLVLDEHLKVVSANSCFYETFQMPPDETIGGFIYDLRNGQWDIPELRILLEDILPKNTRLERHEIDYIFPGAGRKFLLINARRIFEKGVGTQMLLLVIEDITDRKLTEESLSEAKTLLDKTFSSIKSGVFVIDSATERIIISNLSTELIFGYGRDEIIGLDAGLLYMDAEQFSEKIIPILEINGIYNTELLLRRKDGSTFIGDLTVTDFRDDSGCRIGFVCAVRDITALKQAQDAIIASETRYRRLFEAAQDGILIINADTGQIEDINPFLANMLGYSKEECLGKRLWDIGVFADTTASKLIFAELQRTGYVCYKDLNLVTKDGLEIAVEIISNVYEVDNKQVIQCNIRNITESKEVKKNLNIVYERLTLATNAAAMGIWDWDVSSNTLVWDDRMFELYGISSNSFTNCVEAWQNSLHPDDRVEALEATRKALLGENDYNTDFRVLMPDGTVKHIKACAQVSRDSKGKPLRMTGINYDITGLKRMEEELKKSHAELEKRVEERTAQLSELNSQLQAEISRCKIIETELGNSHERLRHLNEHLQKVGERERALLSRELHDELGQALTGMKMDLSWIAKRLPENNVPAMERIRSLLAIIDKIIMTIQRMSIELRPVALDDFGLNEAVRAMIKDFEKKTDIVFSIISEPRDIILQKEMATEIFRIFQEGVTNIIRHADARNATIFLRQKMDRLILEIKDDGKGISKNDMFSPKSIGLTGMRERAYSIGGTLKVKGVQNKGTTVTLSIPLYQKAR
jgi:PAS domain S-box-containing protein